MNFNLSDFLEESRAFNNLGLQGKRHLSFDKEITPETAFDIVTNYNYKHQRKISRENISRLSVAMLRDKFLPYTSINFAVLNGVPHLVNGQHTLHSIYETKKTIDLSIHFHYVNNYDDIDVIYSDFDVNKPRGINAVIGGVNDDFGFSKQEGNFLVSATRVITNNFCQTLNSKDPDKIFESKDHATRKLVMREWASEAIDCFNCLNQTSSIPNKRLFTRQYVFAVMLITFRYTPQKAAEFWGGAVVDNALRLGDPRKTLIDWLRNYAVRQEASQHRAAISCWNHFVEGKDIRKVLLNTRNSLKILGSPFDLSKNNDLLTE